MMSPIEAAAGELMATPLFRGMSKSQVLELCQGGSIVSSRYRETIFQFGDDAEFFGVVLSGAYKLSKPSSYGNDVIVHFSTPGEVLAAFIMAQARPVFPVSATSMGPSRFLKIPKDTYLAYWKKNTDLILRIQNLLSGRMGLLQDQKVMQKAPLAQRVAGLLINLFEKSPDAGALELPLPLTRKEIADSVGASVEAVIRVMSEWSKLGYIETNDQNIRLLQVDKILDLLKDL